MLICCRSNENSSESSCRSCQCSVRYFHVFTLLCLCLLHLLFIIDAETIYQVTRLMYQAGHLKRYYPLPKDRNYARLDTFFFTLKIFLLIFMTIIAYTRQFCHSSFHAQYTDTLLLKGHGYGRFQALPVSPFLPSDICSWSVGCHYHRGYIELTPWACNTARLVLLRECHWLAIACGQDHLTKYCSKGIDSSTQINGSTSQSTISGFHSCTDALLCHL